MKIYEYINNLKTINRNHAISFKKSLQKFYKKDFKEWTWFLLKLLCLCLTIFILNNLIFCFAIVHGISMNPTLKDGDLLFVRKLLYTPSYNDIVICRTGKGYEEEMVKRIIGLPGDTIDISEDGFIIRNGLIIEESYCLEKTFNKGDINYPTTIPFNQYFVMGDNRNNSTDSRYGEIGTLPKENIDGQVLFRIFPFHKITIL